MADLQPPFPQTGVPHFAEPRSLNQNSNPSTFLPEPEYGLALDALVITCVDVLLVQGNTVLLGKRRRPPNPDWWLVGGRMIPGESPLAAAQRKVKEEAGLSLAGDRFYYIGTYSTCFAERQQPPQNHGLHSVNLTYYAPISEAEQYAVTLTPSEYEDYRWFTPADLEKNLGLGANSSQGRDCSTITAHCLGQILVDFQRINSRAG
jgi:ADP-ribose pyrophosphatase YjhB (NUDIX family)